MDDVFADDSAFFVSADTPHDAVRKLAVVVRLVNHTYRKHALVVNFKAGKTEAMLYLRGPGTVRVKKRLFGELKSLLPICQPLFEQDPQVSYEGLRIVAVYKHMGTVETCSNQPRFEVKYRTGEMYGAFRSMGKNIFPKFRSGGGCSYVA